MDRNLHNIDDLFKRSIDDYEDTPSSSVWENIDRNLDKKKVVSISEKYKRLKWVAAALLIFSVGMAMYVVNTRMKAREYTRRNNTAGKGMQGKNGAADSATVTANKPSTKTPGLPGSAANAALADSGIADRDNTLLPNNRNGNNTVLNKLVTANSAKKVLQNGDGQIQKASVSIEKNEAAVRQGALANNAGPGSEKSIGRSMKIADASAGKGTPEFVDNDIVVVAKPVAGLTTIRQRKDYQLDGQLANLSLGNLPQRLFINNKLLATNGSAATMKKQNLRGLKKSLFSATVFYSPEFVSSRVDNDKRRFREDDRNEIKNKEKIKNASSLGVLLNYNAGNGFSIETGLTISTMTTGIDPKMIYARPDDRGNVKYRINCSAGFSYVTLKPGMTPAAGDSLTALSSSNTLKYMSVPLSVKYNVHKGKLGLHPGVGIAANFLTKGKIETLVATAAGNEKTSSNHIEGLNKNYFSGLISAGVSYDLSKRLALSLTPIARFALSAINKDAPVKTFLNSFGLAAGLNIGL